MTAVLLDLIQPVAPISPQTQGQYVYDRFQAEPDTLAIAVVDEDGRPVGLVERHAFFVAMAAHYGRALYALRPISLLMNPDPLVAEGDTPVAEFCGDVLADRASEVMKGFVVVSGGRYAGVGSSLSLLQAASAANRAHAEEMTRLAETLNRAKQEAQAALSAKSQFLAVMSHEIRTPLNGVLAIADILQRKLIEPELKPYVTTIQDSGQTLLRLLTDALDLSRADAGQLELAEDSFCVPALLDDLSALWAARAELRGLSLDFAYDGAPGQWALGDAVRIKQVFNNLIGNALKFTREGGVEVRLAARRCDIHLQIEGEVRDSGVGIPATAWNGSSSRSARPRPACARAARGWVCRSAGNWWCRWAGPSMWRATAAGPASASPSPCSTCPRRPTRRSRPSRTWPGAQGRCTS
jgi:two-component system, sensor histidine kinase